MLCGGGIGILPVWNEFHVFLTYFLLIRQMSTIFSVRKISLFTFVVLLSLLPVTQVQFCKSLIADSLTNVIFGANYLYSNAGISLNEFNPHDLLISILASSHKIVVLFFSQASD